MISLEWSGAGALVAHHPGESIFAQWALFAKTCIIAQRAETVEITEALVQSIDLYPTLAELCGLTSPADIDGRPFLDLLDDPDLAGPDYAISYNQSYAPPLENYHGCMP